MQKHGDVSMHVRVTWLTELGFGIWDLGFAFTCLSVPLRKDLKVSAFKEGDDMILPMRPW